MTETKKSRKAKVYFKSAFGQLAKDLAASIRSQDSHCNLIDQQFFKGPEDIEDASLVLIQKTAPNAKLIASCYEKFGVDHVQIAFFNDDGKVVREDEPKPEPVNAVDPEPPAGTVGIVADTRTAEGSSGDSSAGLTGVPEGDTEGDADPADSGGISGE